MTFGEVNAGAGSGGVFGAHPYSPFATPVDLLRTLCNLLSPFFTRTVKLGISLPPEEWQQVKAGILWSQRSRLVGGGMF